MSGYKSFAIVGAGNFGNFLVRQFLEDKVAGTVSEVVVLTRQGSKTTIEGDAKVITVDYSNKESIKSALSGVDVVICTLSGMALGLQAEIAEAGIEAGVKLFVPSEFGNSSEGETEGIWGKESDIPYTIFYTGPFADFIWAPFLGLNVPSGKVTIAGDGNKQISFTSRADSARYISYVLTRLPAEQLKNHTFTIAGDDKSFNEIFQEYEAKTGKKVEVTYVPISEYDARLATNANDIPAFLHKHWATVGPFPKTDNYLYPDWNPCPAVDYVPVS
ncbi:hypothetical protein V8E53_008654 [Lactarius tabidus]